MASSFWRWGKANYGKPVRDVPASFLLWMCSDAVQRKLHPDAIRVAVAELRRRLAEPGEFELELLGAASDLI